MNEALFLIVLRCITETKGWCRCFWLWWLCYGLVNVILLFWPFSFCSLVLFFFLSCLLRWREN
jgi:hypothetical protein